MDETHAEHEPVDPAAALEQVVDDTPDDTADMATPGSESGQEMLQERLDAMRIRRLTALRRATLRTRSWYLIAAGGCGLGGLDIGRLAVLRLLGSGLRSDPIGWIMLLIALAAETAAILLWREAQALKRQTHTPLNSGRFPVTPIDPEALDEHP